MRGGVGARHALPAHRQGRDRRKMASPRRTPRPGEMLGVARRLPEPCRSAGPVSRQAGPPMPKPMEAATTMPERFRRPSVVLSAFLTTNALTS